MKQIKFIGTIIIIAIMTACGQTEKPTAWKTFEQNDYKIRYPDNFKLDTSGDMGFSFVLLSKLTTSNGRLQENIISLGIDDLKGQNVSLDDFAKDTEEQIKMMITNSAIIENTRVKKGSSEFQKFIVTGRQGQFDLKFEQYDFIKNGKAYILTFTTEAAQFDNYKNVAEEIMNSFEIK